MILDIIHSNQSSVFEGYILLKKFTVLHSMLRHYKTFLDPLSFRSNRHFIVLLFFAKTLFVPKSQYLQTLLFTFPLFLPFAHRTIKV